MIVNGKPKIYGQDVTVGEVMDIVLKDELAAIEAVTSALVIDCIDDTPEEGTDESVVRTRHDL